MEGNSSETLPHQMVAGSLPSPQPVLLQQPSPSRPGHVLTLAPLAVVSALNYNSSITEHFWLGAGVVLTASPAINQVSSGSHNNLSQSLSPAISQVGLGRPNSFCQFTQRVSGAALELRAV